MTSVKIKFRASAVAGKPGSLYFQIVHRGKVRQIKVSSDLYPAEWDSRSEKIAICGAAADKPRTDFLLKLQEQLLRDTARLDKLIAELNGKGHDYTTDDVVRTFYAWLTELSFRRFMERTVRELAELGKTRTSETYATTLKSFMRFRESRDVLLDELTPELVSHYETWLRSRDLSRNTSSFYMRVLRAAYNRAVEQGLTAQAHPFRHVYTGVEKTVKRAVTFHHVKKIKELELPSGSSLEWARDMFMFSFYTRGMSFVDMAYLRKRDLRDGILVYRRKKTGQLLTIKWEGCMQEIIDKYSDAHSSYLLPIIRRPEHERRQYENALHLINSRLKDISIRGGLPSRLTMHVARHSWATAAQSNRIPLSVISEGMGHGSENTTRIYLASLDNSAIDRANRAILKSVGII